jgi:hypothetical protein
MNIKQWTILKTKDEWDFNDKQDIIGYIDDINNLLLIYSSVTKTLFDGIPVMAELINHILSSNTVKIHADFGSKANTVEKRAKLLLNLLTGKTKTVRLDPSED